MAKKSTEIVRLLESVEQLAEADQDRILKIVSLLTRVPPSVQLDTQRMLRNLLDAHPSSIVDCHEGVDELIQHLENEALAHSGPGALFKRFEHVRGSGLVN